MIPTKVNNAFKRVFSTFKRLNKQMYKEDTEAMQIILETIKTLSEDNVKREPIFIKLVSLLMFEYIHKYGSAKSAVFMIKKNADRKHFFILQLLQAEINTSDILNTFNSMDIDKLEDIDIEQQKILIDKIESFWTIEHIEKSIITLVNDLLLNEQSNEL